MWINSGGITAERQKNDERYESLMRISMAERTIAKAFQELSVKQAKIIKPQSIINGKHRRIISKVAKKTQVIVSACKKKSRTYKIKQSWNKVPSGPQKSHTMTPQQTQDIFGNQWCVVQTTAGRSTKRYQRVNVLNLDKLTALA